MVSDERVRELMTIVSGCSDGLNAEIDSVFAELLELRARYRPVHLKRRSAEDRDQRVWALHAKLMAGLAGNENVGCHMELAVLLCELIDLRAKYRGLRASLDEALNSGDGSYRP